MRDAGLPLREELREPRNYFAILLAIAPARTRLNTIVPATGLGRQPVSRYLAPAAARLSRVTRSCTGMMAAHPSRPIASAKVIPHR